ncbi:ABC transporter ATP-binding protein [Hespellia stercorisuis]|uniref:Putative ABC transport system ATP-binding protein n=1 Tax=Hespellia stercorisuis DSM 15480 TaxID=1121950 RepID=A0A1M6UJ29_9FIRM|nr:putative ABC transport system ATP-binding protein [Hespellia stercorisuis DSM 15480]
MEKYIVRTSGLKKYYQMGKNVVKALDGVDFKVKDGEFVAIIGKSGSGKSTLLHMIGGLDLPTSGEVYVDGRNLAGLNKEQLAIFRRRTVGFIFQSYNLVQDLNVYENIVLPIELDGGHVDTEFVDGILELLQLQEKKEVLPNTLSGGQQQRVAIARAIAAKPAMILADEPTGNLDTATSHDVLGLLKTVARQFEQTIVLITHDQDIAQLADRIVRIEDGQIVCSHIGDGEMEDSCMEGGQTSDSHTTDDHMTEGSGSHAEK